MRNPDCYACFKNYKTGLRPDPCPCDKMLKYREHLERKRKFKQGKTIQSMDELLKQDFVMWYGKTKHISVIFNWQTKFVLDLINSGNLHYAIRKEDNK